MGLKDIDKNFEDNWKFLELSDGSIDKEQLKKELMDFSDLIHNATTVYCEVTGNKLSYPTYSAKTVLSAYRDHLEDEQEFWEECFREENECQCGLEKKDET